MSRVLVFDSGFGGLTVLREIEATAPALDLVYLADDAHFPYGEQAAAPLREQIVETLSQAIDTLRPDAVVIACNTASTLVLPPLRERFEIPFVGTVPAIKPAAEATRTGLISVLATPGTVQRDYTRTLIDEFAGGVSVTLVGAPRLASVAEAYLNGEPVDDDTIGREIAPCFVETDEGRTDHIVLACTHFPLLTDHFVRLAPWPVAWIDPSNAIARRLSTVIAAPVSQTPGPRDFLFSSGRPWNLPLSALAGRNSV